MKTIKLFILPVLLLITLTGCKKDKTPGIVGKWKLEKVKLSYYPSDYDFPTEFNYSENNIIYQFRANGILKVTSDVMEYMGKKPGEYSYHTNYTKTDVIVISGDNTTIPPGEYNVSGNNLVISYSTSDGPIYYFIRI
ncbi:hypothetical protein [Pseudopedobacter beijingensis]|uniref:Lipocalin-like domain-containing protein n=1 Tax=Pseudopedobacter beijingensis TaxID=1207056 RepID=A0ABW4IEL7_9SPHI